MRIRAGTVAEALYHAASPETLAERTGLLRSDAELYSGLLPEGVALLDETLQLLEEHKVLAAEQFRKLSQIPDPLKRLRMLGEVFEPDCLLLKLDAAGEMRLVGGVLCFPTNWDIREKIGKPLTGIHEPVPGLNTAIGEKITQFLGRLRHGAAWHRTNWGIYGSPALNYHPSRKMPSLDICFREEELVLRMEHQSFLALPRSGGMVFLIRIINHSFPELRKNPQVAAAVARALRTMPEPLARYKGFADVRERLIAILTG
jgi:dimethylamine monooxygenase subunit A